MIKLILAVLLTIEVVKCQNNIQEVKTEIRKTNTIETHSNDEQQTNGESVNQDELQNIDAVLDSIEVTNELRNLEDEIGESVMAGDAGNDQVITIDNVETENGLRNLEEEIGVVAEHIDAAVDDKTPEAVPDFYGGEDGIEKTYDVHMYDSNDSTAGNGGHGGLENGDKTNRNGTSTLFSLQDIINTVMTPELGDSGISKMQAVSQTEANISEPNTTVVNSTNDNSTAAADKNKFTCIARNVTENTTALVKIANSTELILTLSFKDVNDSGNCALVMFYAPWCTFCARTAPSFNALARAFPQLMVLAVDAVHFNSLNARFGTVSVPNILLFHNSRAVVRFNQTDRSFQTLVDFVYKYTGLKPNTTVDVTDDDIKGPLPSIPSDDPDKWLIICWLFIITFGGWVFGNSETGQNLWRTIASFGQEHVHID